MLFVVLALALSSGESLFAASIPVMVILGLLALALFIRTLDDLQKSPKANTDKVFWGTAIFVLPFIGPLLYLIMGKERAF